MTKNNSIREYLSTIGKKGGQARAAKFDKATLSQWARKGGRPPKKGKKKGTSK
jgi:general stress protein YciG